MNQGKGWVAAIALAMVATALLFVGNGMRDPQRGAGRQSARAAEAAEADTGVARGGSAPRGQAPVVALTVPRFQNAFNAEAGNHRLLILLSPT